MKITGRFINLEVLEARNDKTGGGRKVCIEASDPGPENETQDH